MIQHIYCIVKSERAEAGKDSKHEADDQTARQKTFVRRLTQIFADQNKDKGAFTAKERKARNRKDQTEVRNFNR
jgi:hypothetical protein